MEGNVVRFVGVSCGISLRVFQEEIKELRLWGSSVGPVGHEIG